MEQGRIPSNTLVCKGEVPTGVNLNRYAGNGSFIPWHCDIVSMSLGHSALFKLRHRASKNSPSQIPLDHGDVLVMDGLTKLEYEHSTAFELEGPRVNLTYRWMSQHVRSCSLSSLIGGALPSDAQIWLSHIPVLGSRGNQNVHDLFNGPLGCIRYMLFPKVCI